MPNYRIGITEAGDAGLEFVWVEKLRTLDGAVLITKDCNSDFRAAVATNDRGNIIVHATITGHGGTVIEPGVPSSKTQTENIAQLIRHGFPIERIVVRIDPIIPTASGIKTAYRAMRSCMALGIRRFRVSVLDAYPHVRERFHKCGIEPPYGEAFSASDDQFHEVDKMLHACKCLSAGLTGEKQIRIECCAEPKLAVPSHSGCISDYDLSLMGLEPEGDGFSGHQRKDCLCYSGKVELLGCKKPCSHNCLYCYWRGV